MPEYLLLQQKMPGRLRLQRKWAGSGLPQVRRWNLKLLVLLQRMRWMNRHKLQVRKLQPVRR
ncbi:hypothetical protein B7993_04425 [Fibrobacter sp. UWH3]|nr:hypothetical protein B7993_04425 [Fibrobacter sp. UWH3]